MEDLHAEGKPIPSLPSFCRYISAEILAPFSLRIISDLVPFLAQATEETLALVLEAIRAVIGVDGNVLNGIVTAQLVDVIYDVWLKNNDGEFVGSLLGDPPPYSLQNHQTRSKTHSSQPSSKRPTRPSPVSSFQTTKCIWRSSNTPFPSWPLQSPSR